MIREKWLNSGQTMAKSRNFPFAIVHLSFVSFGLNSIGACQCRPAFEDCQDQTDNDGDGFEDCQDTDCSNVSFCLPAFCGDGFLDDGEACDNGAQNSDTTPDACRADCVLPSC